MRSSSAAPHLLLRTKKIEVSPILTNYTLTSIMSPLCIEHLDIVTQNVEMKFSIVKLPRYYPYNP